MAKNNSGAGFSWGELSSTVKAEVSKMPGDVAAVDPRAIENVVEFLGEAPKATRALREGISATAANARTALSSGLSKRGLCLLVQDLTPKLRNGDPVPLQTIEGVLTALANIDAFLVTK